MPVSLLDLVVSYQHEKDRGVRFSAEALATAGVAVEITGTRPERYVALTPRRQI